MTMSTAMPAAAAFKPENSLDSLHDEISSKSVFSVATHGLKFLLESFRVNDGAFTEHLLASIIESLVFVKFTRPCVEFLIRDGATADLIGLFLAWRLRPFHFRIGWHSKTKAAFINDK
jgi:hypothetical protein